MKDMFKISFLQPDESDILNMTERRASMKERLRDFCLKHSDAVLVASCLPTAVGQTKLPFPSWLHLEWRFFSQLLKFKSPNIY